MRKLALVIFASSAFFLQCLNPGDEIYQKSASESGILFVKVPGHEIGGMEPERTNINEFKPGTNIYHLSPASPTGKLTNLTVPYTKGKYPGAAMDPEISFDNKKMLFAMLRGSDNQNNRYGRGEWHIYEMDLVTLNLVQLTRDGQKDNMDPAYLPTGEIVFTSTRTHIVDEYEGRESPLLFIGSAERDEKGLFKETKQISFNQSHDINPFVHSSGKIYFSRWEHLGSPNKMPLFTINPDGTGLFVLYGNHSPLGNGQALLHARELRDGRLVTSVMRRGSEAEGGAIALIDISKSDNALSYITPGGNPYDNNQDSWVFQTPYPIMDGSEEKIVVSGARGINSNNGNIKGVVNYGLWLLTKNGKDPKLVYDDPNHTELDPVVIERSSTKIELSGFQSNLDPRLSTTTGGKAANGSFFTSNVNFRSSTDGQMTRSEVNGLVKYLRILEAIPIPGNRNGGTNSNLRGGDIGETNQEKQRVIGYGPVQSDGSFSIELPSNTSLHMQTLDAYGMMLVNQKTWVQVMPGEKRLCTGCHDSHDNDKLIDNLKIQSSSEAVPDSVYNVDGITKYLAGFHNAAVAMSHPSAIADTLDFYDRNQTTKTHTVQAVFDRHCISCHGKSNTVLSLEHDPVADPADNGENNSSRRRTQVYNRLLPDMEDNQKQNAGYKLSNGNYVPYVTDQGARRSPLMWVLFNEQLEIGRNQSRVFRIPSLDHRTIFNIRVDFNPFAPENRDLLTLIEWIDGGAQYSNTVGY